MKKKFISVLSAFALTLNVAPLAILTVNATDTHANEVHVIVENTTFTPDSEDWSNSFWYGELVDTWVTIDNNSTAISCIVEALDKNGYTQTGAENNYIDSINGLKAYDGGSMSGWMGTLNDWFANEGFGAFTVENGKLSEGDEIRMMYTCDWGSDLGSSWSDNDTTIKSIDFSDGILEPAFDKDIHTYTLNISADVNEILITPTASNKNYQVRTRTGDTVYKRTAYVPVEDNTEIIVECNYEGSVSMNAEGEPQSYVFNVKKADSTVEAQDVSEILNSSMEKLAVSVPAPEFGSVGGEWSVICLARGEYFTKDNPYFIEYYNRIVDTVNETAADVDMNGALHKVKSTENSRLIVALSSIGKSAEKVGEWNLLAPYEDFSWLTKQGINGPVWALIALDSNNYQTKNSTIRQQCIDYILENQVENGGWTFGGKNADADMTSMTLQALARYTNDSRVKEAVDKAVDVLSTMQTEKGGYASWGSESSESIAQVVTALTSLGINPDTDARFIKNGTSLIDALLAYYDSETHDFKHVIDGEGNAMATDQAIYALVSYDRLIKGKTSLYDMSDVIFDASQTTETTTTTSTTTTNTTTTTTESTTSTSTSASTNSTTTQTSTVTTTSTTTTTTNESTLPNTGNNNPAELVVCTSAIALTFAGVCIMTLSKKKDEEV